MRAEKACVSIIIPVYYNQDTLLDLYEDIRVKILDQTMDSYEIVMVDDGSEDDSWKVMEEIAAKDERVQIIHLSRNFGSHAAILCGMSNCHGNCAVIKAADMQEPTEIIPEMVQKWREGFNVVLAVREEREDAQADKWFASLYYWMVRKVALKKMPSSGFDIYLVDRKVIETLERMDEKNSALTGQIIWSGFKTATVSYVRKARTKGKSRWTLQKKFRLVTDTLYSFSMIPLSIVSMVGILSSVISVIWAAIVLVGKLTGNIQVSGWTTSFIFQLFSFGVIMLTLGIIGGYLWRTFDAARGRPVYIVEKRNIADQTEKQ